MIYHEGGNVRVGKAEESFAVHPVSLSDEQLNIVLSHAKLVEPAWRNRFLVGLVDELLPLDVVTNEAVAAAASRMSRKMGARAIPVQWRSRYLAAIADQLVGLPVINDADVQRAVQRVAERMGRAVA
jgi:hypothetical protein